MGDKFSPSARRRPVHAHCKTAQAEGTERQKMQRVRALLLLPAMEHRSILLPSAIWSVLRSLNDHSAKRGSGARRISDARMGTAGGNAAAAAFKWRPPAGAAPFLQSIPPPLPPLSHRPSDPKHAWEHQHPFAPPTQQPCPAAPAPPSCCWPRPRCWPAAPTAPACSRGKPRRRPTLLLPARPPPWRPPPPSPAPLVRVRGCGDAGQCAAAGPAV